MISTIIPFTYEENGVTKTDYEGKSRDERREERDALIRRDLLLEEVLLNRIV